MTTTSVQAEARRKEEEARRKAEEAKHQITMELYGRKVVIPRGDMNDTEWAKIQQLSAERAPSPPSREGVVNGVGKDGYGVDVPISVTNPTVGKADRMTRPDVTAREMDAKDLAEQASKAAREAGEALQGGKTILGSDRAREAADLAAQAKQADQQVVYDRNAEKRRQYEEETGNPPSQSVIDGWNRHNADGSLQEGSQPTGVRAMLSDMIKGTVGGAGGDVGQAVDTEGKARASTPAQGPEYKPIQFQTSPPKSEAPDAGPMIRGGSVGQPQTIDVGTSGGMPFTPSQAPDAGVPAVAGGTPDAGAAAMVPPSVPPWIDTRGPGQVVRDGFQTIGAMVGPGAAQALGSPPVGGPPPVPAPGAPGVGGSSSASLSMRTPGVGTPTPGANGPAGMGPMPDFAGIADAKAKAIKEQADIQAKANLDSVKLYQQAQEQSSKVWAEQQKRNEYITAQTNDVLKSQAEVSKILSDPSKTPDPERYWKSHSRVLFAIGVGLLAANGNDISGVLQNVQHAIDNDIEAQKNEFEAPKKAARDQFAVNTQVYGMLRQQGLDSYEASRMAAATIKDQLVDQIQMLTAKTNNDLLKANAPALVADLQMQASKDKEEATLHRQQLADQQFQAQTARINAEANMIEARVKASKGVGGGGKQISAEEADKIGKIKAGADLVDQLKVAYKGLWGSQGGLSGTPGSMAEKGAAHVPGSDAKAYNALRDNALRTIGLNIDQSVLQKHDVEQWEELLPKAGDLNAIMKLNKLRQIINESYAAKVGSLGSAGYNVSGFAPSIVPREVSVPGEGPPR